MMKNFYCFLFSVCFHISIVSAQGELPVASVFRAEQAKFLSDLESVSVDSSILYPILRFTGKETQALYEFILDDGSLAVEDKEKAVRSLMYFMRELSRNLRRERVYIYDVPVAFTSYRTLLSLITQGRSWLPAVSGWEPERIQLMASAFAQYEQHEKLEDLATYKRVAASPELIMQFLSESPGFRYADSLLRDAAAHDPARFVNYLGKNPPVVNLRLTSSTNPYVKEILMLAKDKNGTELMPFVTEIVDGKLAKDSILGLRARVTGYYQLLVNTLIERAGDGTTNSSLLRPLRRGIHDKALQFYTSQVNYLHNETDAIRFASVKNLRPQDIYYVMTASGDELYTSSYLGLFKRLMAFFPDQSADSLFTIVGYDDFHVFMRLAANYNVLADFLRAMPADKSQAMLRRYMGGIGSHSEAGLDRAMDIGDSFGALTSEAGLMEYISGQLASNLEQSRAAHHYLGIRLYGILQKVFSIVKQDGSFTRLWETLGNYDLLNRADLQSASGEIVEVLLFYGDEDGIASFKNFMSMYRDGPRWKVERNDHYVRIRSKEDSLFSIFANVPLDMAGELDLRAQDTLFHYMAEQGLRPSIIIHRGHSYHLDKTLKRLTPSVRLAVLGSCGGYNRAISIANINPDVHIIGSKKTGSKLINDPMIEEINNTLVSGKNLYWPGVWTNLAARFANDPGRLALFNEYFPPASNAGLFVLKMFGIYQGRNGLVAR